MGEEHADQGFRKLRETMAGMTPKEKWDYYWGYYKGVTIGVIVAVILVGMLVYDLTRPKAEVLFSGATVNVTLTEKARTGLTDDLLAALEGTADQAAELSASCIADDSGNHDAASNYTEIMKLVARIADGELDYLLMDTVGKDYFFQQETFIDLREVLSETQQKELEDRFVWWESEDGRTFPVAIDLAGTALADACTTADGQLYIAFPGNTGREERIPTVVDYILNWK